MLEKRVSGLPVVNERGELVGNISMSDIKLIGWNADYWNILGLPIREYIAQLASHPESLFIRNYNFWNVDRPQTVILKCAEQNKLSSVVKMMNFYKVHRIYKVGEKEPTGVISMYDVLKVVCNFSTVETQ